MSVAGCERGCTGWLSRSDGAKGRTKASIRGGGRRHPKAGRGWGLSQRRGSKGKPHPRPDIDTSANAWQLATWPAAQLALVLRQAGQLGGQPQSRPGRLYALIVLTTRWPASRPLTHSRAAARADPPARPDRPSFSCSSAPFMARFPSLDPLLAPSQALHGGARDRSPAPSPSHTKSSRVLRARGTPRASAQKRADSRALVSACRPLRDQ